MKILSVVPISIFVLGLLSLSRTAMGQTYQYGCISCRIQSVGESRLSVVTIRQIGTTIESSVSSSIAADIPATPSRLVLDVDCDLDELIERYSLVLTISGTSSSHHLNGNGGFINVDYADTDSECQVQYAITFKDETRLGNQLGTTNCELRSIGTVAKLNVSVDDTTFIVDWAQVGRDPLVGKLIRPNRVVTQILGDQKEVPTIFAFYSNDPSNATEFAISGSPYGMSPAVLSRHTLNDLKKVSIFRTKWNPATCSYVLEPLAE